MRTVVKRLPDAPADFFEAEAAGLRWLADAGGARLASVAKFGPGFIELEYVEQTAPSPDAARSFGRALARTHTAGAAAFGAPPDGYQGTLYIGRRAMPSARERSWGTFYARDRVLPFLQVALEAGNVSGEHARVVREACALVAAGRFDDDEPPARIHGDLWTGNVLWSPDGVVLIDPAAHGGHRETDLAMLALFGCPHLEDIVAGYESAAPLREGWRARVPLHQLHPLAVHAAGHGPAYGTWLHEAALEVIELAGAA